MRTVIGGKRKHLARRNLRKAVRALAERRLTRFSPTARTVLSIASVQAPPSVLWAKSSEVDSAAVSKPPRRTTRSGPNFAKAKSVRARDIVPAGANVAEAGSNSSAVTFWAIDEPIPPPRVAKHAPQMNAVITSHHGSGSKRSTHRMKNRYVSTSGVNSRTSVGRAERTGPIGAVSVDWKIAMSRVELFSTNSS